MKQYLTLAVAAAGLALAAVPPPNPDLVQVKAVYLLPMNSSLDQFLAVRLTRLGVVQVVTDPQKADAILTDHLGEPFERAMKELYRPAAPPEKPKEDGAKDGDKEKEAGKSTAADRAEAARLSSESSQPRVTTFGRGRGTVFLVDRRTMNVVWSYYARPKDHSPDTMEKTADKIAHRLSQDRNPQPRVTLDASSH